MFGLAGTFVGWRLSCLRSRWWLAGYLGPLFIILLCGAAFRHRALELIAPFSWLVSGRREYVVLAFCGAMLFGVLLPKLRLRRQRALLGILIAVIVLVQAAWPFLAPVFNKAKLAALTTTFDGDGVCLQNTSYTCGPAAAVTALKQLGIAADEGELAILCGTTDSTGTPPDVLTERLNFRFHGAGLQAVHRAFRSTSGLHGQTPALAWVRFAFLTDHVVAVLEVTSEAVVLGDPFRGKRVLTHGEFEREWRFVGVTLRRANDSSVRNRD